MHALLQISVKKRQEIKLMLFFVFVFVFLLLLFFVVVGYCMKPLWKLAYNCLASVGKDCVDWVMVVTLLNGCHIMVPDRRCVLLASVREDGVYLFYLFISVKET